jgi:hypothetical protein
MSSFRVAPSGPSGHQIMISQGGGMNPSHQNPGLVMNRGMNPNNMMQQMQHNRPMMDGQQQMQLRMRTTTLPPQDHMRQANNKTAVNTKHSYLLIMYIY